MARDKAYRRAEQKIEEPRRSGAKKLNLSAHWDMTTSALTVLPQSLGQLTQLQSLDLSRNQLAALPEWLGQFTQLQSLASVATNWRRCRNGLDSSRSCSRWTSRTTD